VERPSQDSQAIVDLVRRAQRKDAEAFAALIRRYERMALSVAYSASGDADAAGDAVQDAFAKAWEKLPTLDNPARFGTWLCGIVRNGAIDQRRRARIAPRPVLDALPEAAAPAAADLAGRPWGDDPSDQIQARERDDILARALESLDDVSRSAVVLRYYQGLSSKEIGELLSLNATAVDMRLSRARQQIKQVLLMSEAFADENAKNSA
jgi:RNA polymerase sigma-70 factor (ECF subfamily)